MTSNLPGDPRDVFKPEFINRIDEIIRFRSLARDDMAGIVSIQLGLLEERLEQRRLSLSVDDAARDWLATHGYDEVFGARPLKRLIHRDRDKLAMALLEGKVTDGDVVHVGVEADGEASPSTPDRATPSHRHTVGVRSPRRLHGVAPPFPCQFEATKWL